MEKSRKVKILPLAGLILGSSIIWGAVIVGCSLKLKGTECYSEIQNILAIGVVVHLIIIWGPLAAMFRKLTGENE